MNRDITTKLTHKPAIYPQVQTNSDTAFVSQILDTAGNDAAEVVLSFGAISDADVTFTVLLEDGDAANLSDAAAVADEFLIGTEALATPLFSSDNKVFKLGYIGGKRYIRLTVTPSGNNSGSINIAATWIGLAKSMPTSNPPA